MLAAEAAADILSGRRSEPQATAEYERACKKAFQFSFGQGTPFRSVVRTNALDWLVAATDQPLVQSATAKLMAQI